MARDLAVEAEGPLLVITNAVNGDELHRIARADVEFPQNHSGAEYELDYWDILSLCGIPKDEWMLVDLLDENCFRIANMPPLPWTATLHVRLMRNRCPRCTVCEKKCTRANPHVLCAHGGIDHLWRKALQCGHLVEGYVGQCGLGSLDPGLVQAELAAILHLDPGLVQAELAAILHEQTSSET
jgi:hypothetical protein